MDIPMLAFLLAGFALYFEHVQGRRRALVLASVCFVLAAGTGYTALVPLGCFFIGLLAGAAPLARIGKRRGGARRAGALAGGNDDPFRRISVDATVQLLRVARLSRHQLSRDADVPGRRDRFPLAGGREASFSRRDLHRACGDVRALACHAIYPIWIAVLASSGIAMLVLFALAARRLILSGKNHGEGFLLLWVPATLLFFIVVGDMINARYILLTVPALYLVIFRDTSEAPADFDDRADGFPVGRFGLCGLLICECQSRLGRANRRSATTARFSRVERRRIRAFGFIWSRKASSALTTTRARAPTPADLVVRHAGFPFRYSLSDRLEPLLVVLKNVHARKPISRFGPLMQCHAPGCTTAGWDWRLSRFHGRHSTELKSQSCVLFPGAVYGPKGPIFKQTEAEREFQMKLPANSKIEYEVQGGDGIVAVTDHGFRLIKGKSPVIVWRNFQIVPKQFAVQ